MNAENKLPPLNFEKKLLSGGAVVIVVPVRNTRLVSVNMLFRTGSRDESPGLTGLAHLMEHLMFSGTEKYPAFDLPITRVGGINNAFTTQDLTNYYMVLPSGFVPLAFDLEADRMQNLVLNEKSVEVQKSVVVEEFRQRYLNQPYGDMNHLLYAAAYRKHHYRWPTIGLSPEHIESASAGDVLEFYRTHYHPSNLIIAVAGNVDVKEVMELADSCFAGMAPGVPKKVKIPGEDEKDRGKREVVKRNVPESVLTVAYPIPGIDFPDYTGFWFLADVLGQGIISRLHLALVRDNPLFTRISANVSGTVDPGLFIITGVLQNDADSLKAAEAIQQEIGTFISQGPTPSEMKSIRNGMLTSTLYKRQNVMNLALEVAMAEFEGGAEKVNQLFHDYFRISPQLLTSLAGKYLSSGNRIELHYLKEK